MAEVPKRPTLTLPPEESAALTAAYEAASVILEYGTGGSTVVAGDLPGKLVFSVESSGPWLKMMTAWFAAHPPKATLHLHHGNIGKTREWGYPIDNRWVSRWPGYPISVWDRPDFQHPDVVLIDGRFRLACLYTTALRITRPVTVLWDDYLERPNYHRVEDLVAPPVMVGRMARFDLQPLQFQPQNMGVILNAFMRPG